MDIAECAPEWTKRQIRKCSAYPKRISAKSNNRKKKNEETTTNQKSQHATKENKIKITKIIRKPQKNSLFLIPLF